MKLVGHYFAAEPTGPGGAAHSNESLTGNSYDPRSIIKGLLARIEVF